MTHQYPQITGKRFTEELKPGSTQLPEIIFGNRLSDYTA